MTWPCRAQTTAFYPALVFASRPADNISCRSRQYFRTVTNAARRFDLETHSDATTKNASHGKVVNPQINPFGVQLLSEQIQERLFPPAREEALENDGRSYEKKLEIAKSHLEKRGFWGKKTTLLPSIKFDLPPLEGDTVQEHFYNIGQHLAGGYIEKCKIFANNAIPQNPETWARQAGWTRYDAITGKITSVPYPLEEAIVFDTEVLYKASNYPVIATAVSSKAWYSWVSRSLLEKDPQFEKGDLIPLGPTQRKGASRGPDVVVGHHVGFDRARIQEEYDLSAPKRAYIDTLSLHIATSGFASHQQAIWLKFSKGLEVKSRDVSFCEHGSLNSLADCAKFYTNMKLDKADRSWFESGTLEDIDDRFQQLMTYCANDTKITFAVFQKTLENFLRKCPHPVSFAGVVQMSQSFLPTDESWDNYIKSAEGIFQSKLKSVEDRLATLARDAAKLSKKNYESDPWLKHLDWTPKTSRAFAEPIPAWFRSLHKKGVLHLSSKNRTAPYLMRLKWHGFPVYHSTEHGWTYRVEAGAPLDHLSSKAAPVMFSPASDADISDFKIENAKTRPPHPDAFAISDVEENGAAYYKIPHKDGDHARCGSPLANGYIHAMEEKILTSDYHFAREVLDSNAQCAYWLMSRERIMNQFVRYDNSPTHPGKKRRGMILPQMTTMGTITRRAVERTWLTAANPDRGRVGSELKSLISAPPGYKIIGADVDSQELWICAILGDAQFGLHGSTALGWMMLQGQKADLSDMHSVTASILGIDRSKAKIFNYSRLYGAGVGFTSNLLSQFDPKLSAEEAKEKADGLFSETRGRKTSFIRDLGRQSIKCFGGSESFTFNSIEHLGCGHPRTPTLSCEIPDALLPSVTSRFLGSRSNWVVQSSGVDYLHLLLVSMEYLTNHYNIDARYMLSVHDEVRFMVADKDVERGVLALQIANIWTRAMFSARLGVESLPQSCAFFSSVEIDNVLRKEVDLDCVTPSQASAIAPGESRDILETLRHTSGGSFGPVSATASNIKKFEKSSIPPQLLDVTENILKPPTELLEIQASSSPAEVEAIYASTQFETKSTICDDATFEVSSTSENSTTEFATVTAEQPSKNVRRKPAEQKSPVDAKQLDTVDAHLNLARNEEEADVTKVCKADKKSKTATRKASEDAEYQGIAIASAAVPGKDSTKKTRSSTNQKDLDEIKEEGPMPENDLLKTTANQVDQRDSRKRRRTRKADDPQQTQRTADGKSAR